MGRASRGGAPGAGPLAAHGGAPRKITYFAGPAADTDLKSLFSAVPTRTAAPMELILLLNTTGIPALTELPIPPITDEGGARVDAQRQIQPWPSFARRVTPDPVRAFSAWLGNAFLDRLPGSRIAVYGFDASLERYCRPTRDAGEILAAIRGAAKRLHGATIASGQRSGAKGAPRGPMRWDEAIASAAQDAAEELEDAYRVMLPILRGLPADDSHPLELAKSCRDLGITLYPMFRDLLWPDSARSAIVQGRSTIVPAGPGLDWGKMTTDQRLAWIERKEREFAEFKRLGPETGGRADDGYLRLGPIMDEVEMQARWMYAAGFTQETTGGAPREHKLEVRLRDGKPGVVEGGTRTVVY